MSVWARISEGEFILGPLENRGRDEIVLGKENKVPVVVYSDADNLIRCALAIDYRIAPNSIVLHCDGNARDLLPKCKEQPTTEELEIVKTHYCKEDVFVKSLDCVHRPQCIGPNEADECRNAMPNDIEVYFTHQ